MPIILTNEPVSEPGGIQRYVARLAKAFAELSLQVNLIEPASGRRAFAIPGVQRTTFTNRSRIPAILAACVLYIKALCHSPRDFAIASIWFPSGIAAALLPRYARGPLAILAHGSELLPGASAFRLLLMRWTFRRADIIIANSSLTRELLRSSGVKGNIVVISCGVDQRQVNKKEAASPVILSVGRLIPRKGFDMMIEALPDILSSVPNVEYRIVGDGPQSAELHETASRLGVSNNVTFLGALSDEALAKEYDSAWCFAMPCRRIGDDVEGFGIVYLEAAIASVPAIGGIGSGAEDAIQNGVTGLLVDGTNIDQIARAVITLLSDPEYRATVGSQARERAVSNFGWSNTCQAIRDAFSNQSR